MRLYLIAVIIATRAYAVHCQGMDHLLPNGDQGVDHRLPNGDPVVFESVAPPRDDLMQFDINNGTDTDSYIRIRLEIEDQNAGVRNVDYKLTIHTPGKTSKIVAEDTKLTYIDNIAEHQRVVLFTQTLDIKHCLFAVSHDDLHVSSGIIEITAYNEVLLNTTRVLQVANLSDLNGLKTYSGPTNISIEDETPSGFRVTWDHLEEENSCYESAEMIIVLVKYVDGTPVVERFSVSSSLRFLDIHMAPGTMYTIQFRMIQPNGTEGDLVFAALNGQTPCLDGKYGIECSFNCSQCKNGTFCDTISGYCPDGCEPLWYYDACDITGNITISGINSTNIRAKSGTEIQISCKADLYISAPSKDAIVIQWLFGDVLVHPGANSRFSITSTKVNNRTSESMLIISSVLTEHTGLYTCVASSGPIHANQSVQVTVMSPPTVVIDPRSKTMEEGKSLEIECKLIIYEEFTDFRWYRNGKRLQLKQGERFTNKNTSEILRIDNITETTTFGCEGNNSAGISARVYSYIGVILIVAEKSKPCPAVTEDGKAWPQTAPDSFVVIDCDQGHTGEIKRFCDTYGLFGKPVYNCLKVSIEKLKTKLDKITDGISNATLPDIVTEMKNETSDVTLHNTDMEVMLEIMDIVADNTDAEQTVDTGNGEKETEDFISIASNMIGTQNKKTWVSRLESGQNGAIVIPELVEKYVLKKVANIASNSTQVIFTQFNTSNIYVELGRDVKQDYELPLKKNNTNIPRWMLETETKLQLDAASFTGISAEYVTFTSSMYRDITDILTDGHQQNGSDNNLTGGMSINADIVSVQIMELVRSFSPPARIHFQHFNNMYSNPKCSYWNSTLKAFATDGCHLLSTSADTTVCACNHFTNFAILMSPVKTTASNVMALSVISAVGCAISIFCLLLTIVSHALVWRVVKDDKVVILMNLCTVLVVSYIVFLAGVGSTANKAACTTVAIFLHYLYLVVFFLMLANGVEIAVSVMFVFDKRSYLKLLLALAWGIPIIIVAISLGSTKAYGYGNDTFCWLSINSGLVWAFVVPALTVITINFAILTTVLFKMCRMKAMRQKSEKERAKTAIRSVCVLTPIFGLTWLFGVFSVNEDLVAFQYIFAIFNSLQGLFIFVFYCIFNPKVRYALTKLQERRRTLASIENDIKQLRMSGTESISVIQSPSDMSEVSRCSDDIGDSVSDTMGPFYNIPSELTKRSKTAPNITDDQILKVDQRQEMVAGNSVRESAENDTSEVVSPVHRSSLKNNWLQKNSAMHLSTVLGVVKHEAPTAKTEPTVTKSMGRTEMAALQARRHISVIKVGYEVSKLQTQCYPLTSDNKRHHVSGNESGSAKQSTTELS